jgi:septal ring factor EnvC (AmiA/AmiB activator)
MPKKTDTSTQPNTKPKMKKILTILLCIVHCTICTNLSAQTIKELEAQKKKALDELAVTNRLLNETQKNKKGTENKLNLLKQSIKQSTNYINALNQEIEGLDANISNLQASRLSHQERLNQLKYEYAISTRAIYSHHKYFSPIIFIFSADNFNQAIRRFRYLQQVAAHRKYQAREIEKITNQLIEEEHILTENRIQKETAVSAKTLEQQRLEQQRQKRNEELASLKKKETSLKKKQKEQQAKADKLNQKIQNMIAAEIKRQKEEAAAKAKKEGKKDPYELSKEEKLVAGNFEANKGKLPRPVEKGLISGHFGIQPHPFLDKVQVNNKGTYFQIPAGSDARAVFEGEVTQCFSVPGSNQSVIIKHGNYRTVYSNLVTLYVKVGDKVSTKQKIGKVYTDTENDNKTELYFMLYKDTEIQNPESWLAN